RGACRLAVLPYTTLFRSRLCGVRAEPSTLTWLSPAGTIIGSPPPPSPEGAGGVVVAGAAVVVAAGTSVAGGDSAAGGVCVGTSRSEVHTSGLQSRENFGC